MKKDSFIAYDEWDENTEDLTDEEFGKLMRAVFRYKKTGEKPTFSDRTMKACWKPIKQSLDRTIAAYEAQCERNRENGKKGGRPKKEEETEKPKKANGFFENPPERERERERERKPEPERGRGPVREREEVPPSADTPLTTTGPVNDPAVLWNQSNVTKKIRAVISPNLRRERTEMAIAVAGGYSSFLDLIRSLDDMAYFRKHKVDYDWFVNPENFQNVLEGKYQEDYDQPVVPPGWEVI